MQQFGIETKCATVLLTYARPKHTEKVIEALRRDQVQNIYFFSDGPKSPQDSALVEETRLLAQSITWTTPKTIFRNENLGLGKSVLEAANLVFSENNQLIMLEDDCVPGKHFFEMAYKCLNKFESNMEIFGFSGYSPDIPDSILNNYPYDILFLPRSSSWGWATWKNRWDKKIADVNLAAAQCLKQNISLSTSGEDIPLYIWSILNGQLKQTWTIPWALTVNANKAVFAFPTKSQIDNIGFDGTGVHCGESESPCVGKELLNDQIRIPDFQFINAAIYKAALQKFKVATPINESLISAKLKIGK